MVKSAFRVLDLLELFTSFPTPMGVSEVARRLQLPKSSTLALLQTLTVRGYLRIAGTEYEMDPTLKGGGWVGGLRWHLARLSKPILTESAARSGETVIVAIVEPDYSVRYIAKAVSPQAVHSSPPLELLHPAHTCSTGLLYLSTLPEAVFEAWLANAQLGAFVQSTATDPQELRSMMPKIREQGYAESVNGYAGDAMGVSFPVLDVTGCMIGGMHLSAPSERYLHDRNKIIKETQRVAASVSVGLQALGKIGKSQPL